MTAPPENPVTVLESSNGPFERVIHLTGRLTDEQRARLLTIAEKCPVSQTLVRPSMVISSLADVSSAVPA
ncbi:MAG: hypothetical protein GEU91_22470 [Rhizobiales bacterium]|nr:hypothetical protein [Hyphomicrobiales bacterium]